MKKELKIEFESLALDQLSEKEQELIRRAQDVSKSAYAPYSKFLVGAAVLLDNGEIIAGSNQENVAYPSGLCAERVALFYAGANYPNEKVVTIAIVAKGDLLEPDAALSPCGGCRQVMAETEMRQDKDFNVILLNQNGEVSKFKSASDLLPLTFGK